MARFLTSFSEKNTGTFQVLPYFLLSWIHMLFMTLPFFQSGNEGHLISANFLFHITAWPFYAVLYLLPAFIPIWLLRAFSRNHPNITLTFAIVLTSLCLIFIWSDGMIFRLYAFHINRFVLNLVFTTGGIESLNSSNSTYFSITVVIVRIVIIQAVLLLAVTRKHRYSAVLDRAQPGHASGFFLILFFVQGICYGIGDVTNNAAVLEHAYDYPFFQKVRFRSLAGKFGYQAEDRTQAIRTPDNSRLSYPLHEVTFNEVHSPPNIVWLVAESLRFDQLTEEIMPNSWLFSDKAWRFDVHYSSGNGTREGMFGMFYGLYGSYWDSFLHARQSPILMDRLQALDYRFDIRTGAKFTYPEFDRTILANLPASTFHEADDELIPWQRDEENTSAMIRFLEQEHSSPFMTFQFFESTHAPYFFPETDIIRDDYMDTLNYADFSKDYLDEHVSGILNRYRNAGHWVDRQIGRILASLEQNQLLDNTVVIITGDHGEEFMEKGNWGHNSTFVEEQTRVPLVLYLPGTTPKQFTTPSSHLDIATTLLGMLGADEDTGVYSLGINLLQPHERDAINISDWHSIAVVTDDLKIRIPYISLGFDNWVPTDPGDNELGKQEYQAIMAQEQGIITRMIRNTSVFTSVE